jgi:hypothetical protein
MQTAHFPKGLVAPIGASDAEEQNFAHPSSGSLMIPTERWQQCIRYGVFPTNADALDRALASTTCDSGSSQNGPLEASVARVFKIACAGLALIKSKSHGSM